jgi:hypothetical protein
MLKAEAESARPDVKRRLLLDEDAFVLTGVLAPATAARLVALTEAASERKPNDEAQTTCSDGGEEVSAAERAAAALLSAEYTFWNVAQPEKRDYRNAFTLEVVDQRLADVLWQRIRPHVVPTITINEGDDRWERGMLCLLTSRREKE